MKKKILSFLIVPALLVIGLISGCYYDEVIPDVSIYEEDPNGEVTFSEDIIPIFNAGCNSSGCHGSVPGDIAPDLSTANAYSSLFNGGYINVDKPEQSELYQWVNGNRSTPMPINGTDPKIASAILSWITQGAQNN
jgi:hypothetical protein